MTLKTYLSQTTEQQTTKDNGSYDKHEKTVEGTWSKFCDSLTQPLSRVVEITKIRFDSHMYIEIKILLESVGGGSIHWLAMGEAADWEAAFDKELADEVLCACTDRTLI